MQACEVAVEVGCKSERTPTVSLLPHNVGVNDGRDACAAAAQSPERWALSQRGSPSAHAPQAPQHQMWRW